jgi:glyoxylase-like metal-dependent hydrolase (beta-lactamase superfamily II)
MKAITDGIYYQDVYAGVILGAVILPQGSLIIDSPFRPEEARSWKSILLTQSRGIHRLMVNLDEHIDRTLGNRYMNLTILAHKKTAEAIENRSHVFKGQNFQTGSEWEKFPETIGARWTPANITFEDRLQLHWGNHKILLDHRPGPTPGAIWVEIPSEQIVFIGDAVVVDQPPFLAEADIPCWLEILNILRSRKYSNYTIISGRSGPITSDDVKNQLALLKSILGRMETIAKRKSPSESIEKMIPVLLPKMGGSNKNNAHYAQRLRYGLQQYYFIHYDSSELTELEKSPS